LQTGLISIETILQKKIEIILFSDFAPSFTRCLKHTNDRFELFHILKKFVFRCYAIVYPMKAKSVCTVRKAKIVLAFVWIGSFVLAIPTVFIQVI
jgi:hypothetical protein